MPLPPNFRGALLMVLSTFGFGCNDAVTKLLSAGMNVGEIMFVRGLLATSLIALLAWRAGALANIRAAFHPAVAVRVAGEVCSTAFFLTALPHIPLANATAIMQALPLALTCCAALFLGESVGWRRWLAVAAGFSGVLLIVRPGAAGFNIYGLMVLASVAACALRDLATRRAPAKIPSLLMTAATSLCVTLAGGLLIVPYGGWVPVQPFHLGFFALGAGLLFIGYQCLIMSNRIGDLSFIAPFRYIALLNAGVLGYLLFGEVPDAARIAGALIIVGSGLYMLYRERVRGRRIVAETVAASVTNDGL